MRTIQIKVKWIHFTDLKFLPFKINFIGKNISGIRNGYKAAYSHGNLKLNRAIIRVF